MRSLRSAASEAASPTISAPTRSAAPGPFVDDADEAPAREHGDAVADLEQLVEVGRDDERGAARLRELAGSCSRTARVVFTSRP